MNSFTVGTIANPSSCSSNSVGNCNAVGIGGSSIAVEGSFVREGTNCAQCTIQVHMGFVKIGDGFAATNFVCIYSGNPNEEIAQSYPFSENMVTPLAKGDYYLEFVTVFDYSCGASFEVGEKGTRVSGKRVGTLRVKESGVGRRVEEAEEGERKSCASAIDLQEMSKSNSSGLYCIMQDNEWVVYGQGQDQGTAPRRHHRRLGTEYTGNEGMRVTGGLYSEVDFIEMNSTVEVWPHIYAQIPVRFKFGAMHLDFIDKARGAKMMEVRSSAFLVYSPSTPFLIPSILPPVGLASLVAVRS